VAQLPVAPQIKPNLPIQAKFAVPTRPTGTPDVKTFNLVQPSPVARPPVLDIKQTLPIPPTRQIVPEAADPTTAKFVALPAAAPVAPPQAAPLQVAATPAPIAPAPQLASTDVADATGTLQPEVSGDAAPAAPQAPDAPTDTQALIQGDAAPAPVAAPPAPAAPVTHKKEVRVYVQDTSDGYSNGGYGSGYQPRIRYTYDAGYGDDNGYNGGGNYGSDGCE